MAYTAGSPKTRHALVETLELGWDAIVLDHVQSGWALDVVAGHLDHSTVVVHVSHNDERSVRSRVAAGTSTSRGARFALDRDARKVATLEDRLLRSADLVTAITADDAVALQRRRPGQSTVVLTPGYDGPRVAHREITSAVPRRAVIAGSLLWRVKQFDLGALLRVADARFAAAGAEIVVIGEAPASFETEILRMTRVTRVLGRVDSLTEELSQARLALVSEPHGGGFKLKTLDYVFHRIPLFVQTGSVSGLPLENGDGLLEFASVDALVDGALNALDDLSTLNRLQNDAYAHCEGAFDWTVAGKRLAGAIAQEAASRR
jgi:glycosyltransferase involved in cell wall biosynthesis